MGSELQFENIWRDDVMDLVENGFAAKFNYKKWEGVKNVAIVGAGPAGLKILILEGKKCYIPSEGAKGDKFLVSLD